MTYSQDVIDRAAQAMHEYKGDNPALAAVVAIADPNLRPVAIERFKQLFPRQDGSEHPNFLLGTPSAPEDAATPTPTVGATEGNSPVSTAAESAEDNTASPSTNASNSEPEASGTTAEATIGS